MLGGLLNIGERLFFLESRVTTKLWACSDVASNLAGIFVLGCRNENLKITIN